MDILILVRVALALDDELRGAVLHDVRFEPPHRVRVLFRRGERPASLLVALAPTRPWLGRPCFRAPAGPRTSHPFVSAARTLLRGRTLREVTADHDDRRVRLRLGGGVELLVEPVPHRANAVLLDDEGRVVASFRTPRPDRARLAVGVRWQPAPAPPAGASPFVADPDEIDRLVRDGGADPVRSLRRAVLGLSRSTAELVIDEAGAGSPGTVLRRRAVAIATGEVGPVVECATAEPAGLPFEPEGARLLAWEPARPAAEGRRRIGRDGPAATAGWFHDTLDEAGARDLRRRGLVDLLARETDRVTAALAASRADARAFEDPDRHRRHGEALLAGLRVARRVEGGFHVPDPWAADGAGIVVPAEPGATPAAAADAAFGRHRRAVRGERRAAERREALATRLERLRVVRDGLDPASADPDALEAALREAGIPVGLGRPDPGDDRATRALRPRLDGVRMLAAGDGTPILVGRSGRDNHRLTFAIAGPEDFWFHVADRPGAHVVVRNPGRATRPGETALRDAAAAAAWYSEARREGAVEVRWTRRKYVRRPRGAAPGTVVVKRYETVRVRPRPLDGET